MVWAWPTYDSERAERRVAFGRLMIRWRRALLEAGIPPPREQRLERRGETAQ